jgi:hypothetical protein
MAEVSPQKEPDSHRISGKRSFSVTTIDEYSFGAMNIAGRRFTADLIILPNGQVVSDWWRAEGHSLAIEDLSHVVGLSERPAILVIGTGAAGRMNVPDEARQALSAYGIVPRVAPTPEAVEAFNSLSADQPGRVAGAFHLTC